MNYVQLPDEVLPKVRNWSAMQLAIWADVHTMNKAGMTYYRTNEQLAERWGADDRTVRRVVSQLIACGAVTAEQDGKRRILVATTDFEERKRTKLSPDKSVPGPISPRTNQSAKEDQLVRDGGPTGPEKEDQLVPQVEHIVEQEVNQVVEQRPAKKKKEPILMPFESERFAEVWATWKEYKRTEKRFSYKSHVSEQEALAKLQKLSNDNEQQSIEIIQQSIANGWSGFFPLRDGGSSRSTRTVDAASTLEWLKSPRRNYGYY